MTGVENKVNQHTHPFKNCKMNAVVPSYQLFHSPWFQLIQPTVVRSRWSSSWCVIRSVVASHYVTAPASLTSLDLISWAFIISVHKSSEYSKVRYFEREKQTTNTQFLLQQIIIIVLLLIIAHFLLYLIYVKLYHMYEGIGKNTVYTGFDTIRSFGHPLGVLEHRPCV